MICSELKTDAYRYDEQEVIEMFKDAREYKSIRQSAGFSLSKKLDQALIKDAKNKLNIKIFNLEKKYENILVIYLVFEKQILEPTKNN